MTGGELLQRFVNEDNLTESEAAYYLRQLLLAVEYMHSRNVIHLDLKVVLSTTIKCMFYLVVDLKGIGEELDTGYMSSTYGW